MDPKYIIYDLSDVQIEAALSFPPQFFVIFQALYESFFDKDWAVANKSLLIDRMHKQISHQIHLSFEAHFPILHDPFLFSSLWPSHD